MEQTPKGAELQKEQATSKGAGSKKKQASKRAELIEEAGSK